MLELRLTVLLMLMAMLMLRLRLLLRLGLGLYPVHQVGVSSTPRASLLILNGISLKRPSTDGRAECDEAMAALGADVNFNTQVGSLPLLARDPQQQQLQQHHPRLLLPFRHVQRNSSLGSGILLLNVDPPSLSLKSFLAKQSEAEVVIPTDAMYQAANDYLSRNPLATTADFTFGVTVADVFGSTSTAEKKVKIALTLEPPVLLSDSPASSTISKDQSLDFVVTPQYCPHVDTDYDSGVAIQWSVACPNDLRTADQLLRLSSDGRTASVRPFSLTPGYTYTVTVTLRYTSNASLSTSKSFAVTVETEKIYIRFQYVLVKARHDDLNSELEGTE
ncbi:hypothetical protein Emed_003653 [Eimeria media]